VRQQVLEPVEDCSTQNRPRQFCLPIQSSGLRLYLILHQVDSVLSALIEADFGRRIGRLAALSGEPNGERRGRYRLLCLAYNLFGDSLFEASSRLGGKSTGRCL
jgi:hypothetical protein